MLLDKLIKKGRIDFNKIQPIDVFGEKFAYLKNGYITTGIEVRWPGLFSLTEEEIQSRIISVVLQKVLTLKPGTNITFQNFYKKKFVELENNQEGDFLVESQVKMYEENWKKKYHKSYIFISYPSHYSPSDWIVYDENSFKRIDRKENGVLGNLSVKEKIESTEEVAKVLQDTGIIECKLLDELELRTYGRNYTFLSHFEEVQPGSISDRENCLSIGNKKLITIGLAGNPDIAIEDLIYPDYSVDFTQPRLKDKTKLPSSFIHALGLGLDIDHSLTLSFTVHDDTAFKKRMEKHLKDLKGIGNKFGTNREKAAITEAFVQNVISDTSDRLVSYYLNVQVYDEDEIELNEKKKLVARAFTKVGLPFVVENFLNMDIFLSGLCGNGYSFPRQFISSAQRVCRLFPYESHGYFSDKGILVTSLSGNPGYLDFISKETRLGNRKVKKTNYNITMFGKTGSGKSNLIGYMIMYLVYMKAHIIQIDKGNSFGKLTKILSKMIRTRLYVYSEDQPLEFNPFLIEKKDGRYNARSEERIFLVNLLLGSIEESLNREMVDIVRNLLTDFLLVEYYDRINKQDITEVKFNTFYEFLESYFNELENKSDLNRNEQLIKEQFPISKVLIGLKKYYKEGTYEFLFNASSNYDIQQDQLIVFELDRIQTDPFLFRIVSMCISQIANQKLKSPALEGTLKFLGIDEGTFVLNDYLAEDITAYFKTSRKHGGGILFTDQTLDKLVETGYANPIIGNSDTVVLLEQKWTKNTLQYMRDYLEFTEESIRKAKAIDNSGAWRQGIIKINEVLENFQVNFSPEFFLALNTDNDNKANQRLLKYMQLSSNIKYALKQTLADEK